MDLETVGPRRPPRPLVAALLTATALCACGTASPRQPSPTQLHSPGHPPVAGTGTATPVPFPGGGVVPASIQVPSISVSARVVEVGQTADGDLQAPPGWNSVGWFAAGFRPGAAGHAVLNGHLDSDLASQPTAVFWNLHRLHAGDTVTVTGTDGTVLHYAVTSLDYYPAERARVGARIQ
jgi:Sortase domain